MSDFSKAADYVKELSSLMVNPFNNSVNGALPAPTSTADAMVYVSEGQGTLALHNDTTSLVVAYDPEVTFRNGQARVVVYQKTATGAVKQEDLINVGRVSTDFLAGSIISSALRVSNTSATDAIAGNQSQASLHSIPKVVSSLSSTSLIQNVRDKDSKLISNVNSKFDGTQTMSITEHMGEKLALLRDGAKANLARMGFNISSPGSGADGIAATGSKTVIAADYGATASAAQALYDTNQTGNLKNPLTFATFKCHLSLTIPITFSAAGSVTMILNALDEAGTSLDSVEIEVHNSDSSGGTDLTVVIDQSLVSTTSAIARVTLHNKVITGGGTVSVANNVASGRIEAVEETGDIPGRGVHICIVEGVNNKASINVHAANVIAGIPDSTTAFIAGSGTTDTPEYGISEVTDALQALKYSVQRAYTISGAAIADQGTSQMIASSGFRRAMRRGRSTMMKGFRAFKDAARVTRDTASDAAKVLQPILQKVGGILSDSDEYGDAGAGMLQLSNAIDAAQDSGVLRASYGRIGGMISGVGQKGVRHFM